MGAMIVFRNPKGDTPNLVQAAIFADAEAQQFAADKDGEDEMIYNVRSICWDYNSRAMNRWGVEQGAFSDSIRKYNNPTGRHLPMHYNHGGGFFSDPQLPIGRWDKIYNSGGKLLATGRIFKQTAKGADVAFLCEQGALGAVSVAFWIEELAKGKDAPTVKKATLLEVSVVDVPGHQQAEMFSGGGMPSPNDIQKLFGGDDTPLLSHAAPLANDAASGDEAAAELLNFYTAISKGAKQ